METRYKILAAIWFFQVANYLDRVVVSFAGPSIMKSLSMDPQSFGLVLSSFSIGYFIAQIPGGMLADRWGAKPLLVIAPLIWALLTGVTGLVAGLTGFVAVRVCLGLAEGLSNTSIYKTLGDNFASEERARASSIWATSLAVAPALAGPAVGALLGLFGWQWVFFLMVIPPLLASLVNFLAIPGKRPAEKPLGDTAAIAGGNETSFREALGHPALWVIALAYFSFNIGYWGYLGWMPSYLVLEHHFDVKSMGLLSGIPYVFAFFGMLIFGWLGSGPLYRYRPHLVASSCLLAAISLYLAYSSETVVLMMAGLSSAAFFLYGGLGPFAAILLDLAPENVRASYSGVVNTAGQIGGSIAPLVVGFLVQSTGNFASGFAFMAAALCIAAASYIALIPYLSARPVSVRPAGALH